MRAAQWRKEYQAHQGNSHNLRSAVEATVRSVKHPFPVGKLPVRGKFRMACLIIASAAAANVRRIQCYLMAKKKAEKAPSSLQREAVPDTVASFFVLRHAG